MTSPAPRELLIIEALRADGKLTERQFQTAMAVRGGDKRRRVDLLPIQCDALDEIAVNNLMPQTHGRIDVLRDALDIIGRKV